ncbi:MAG TPA: hypothetical protein EYN89_06220 [Flavobacteriales bacterium]|nr:hypothetical protein [Flavobacteriales bacterium]
MSLFDIAILTESRYINPSKTDWYIENVLKEDGLVQSALEEIGLKVTRVDWADPNFDFSSTRSAIFRTTWDYFHRFEEFSKWLDIAVTKTKLINPLETIRWNIDKHYLNDLKERGVNVPPTVFIEAGEKVTLASLHHDHQLNETVLKPAISGAGRHTYKLNQKTTAKHEEIFQNLLKNESMLLQAFQSNVLSKGEVAYMVFGGKFTHAILKKAKRGDFRVQDDFGGSVELYQPSSEEIAFAENAVSKCRPMPVYARVDVIYDNNNQLSVTEMELIEPELWFRYCPEAADVLAASVADSLFN